MNQCPRCGAYNGLSAAMRCQNCGHDLMGGPAMAMQGRIGIGRRKDPNSFWDPLYDLGRNGDPLNDILDYLTFKAPANDQDAYGFYNCGTAGDVLAKLVCLDEIANIDDAIDAALKRLERLFADHLLMVANEAGIR